MSTPRPTTPSPVDRGISAAFARLSAVLSEVARTADRSMAVRCPHRGVRSRCHYGHPCRNQRSPDGRAVCGGDAAVRFEPVHVEPVR